MPQMPTSGLAQNELVVTMPELELTICTLALDNRYVFPE